MVSILKRFSHPSEGVFHTGSAWGWAQDLCWFNTELEDFLYPFSCRQDYMYILWLHRPVFLVLWSKVWSSLRILTTSTVIQFLITGLTLRAKHQKTKRQKKMICPTLFTLRGSFPSSFLQGVGFLRLFSQRHWNSRAEWGCPAAGLVESND